MDYELFLDAYRAYGLDEKDIANELQGIGEQFLAVLLGFVKL